MSAVSEVFERTRAENRAALVGYLPAGFPNLPYSIKAIEAMVEGGVDLVELGLPYSDPVMDGPTIQAAADMALDGRLPHVPGLRRRLGERCGRRSDR